MTKKNRIDWHSYFQGEHGIRNKAGLAETGIELLMRDFHPIEPLNPGYTERILRYVLDGEGEDILPELEMVDLYFKARHFAPVLHDKATREKLFHEDISGGHDFLERLGRVYHALMNPLNPNFLMPTRFQSPSWLEALLLHVSASFSGDVRTYLQLKLVENLIVASAEGAEELVRTVFFRESFDYSSCEIVSIFFSLIDFPSVAAEHPGHVNEALGNATDAIVLQALTVIFAFGVDPRPFAPTITRYAIGDDPAKRKRAGKIVMSHGGLFAPALAGMIREADEKACLRGVRLLVALGETGAPFLEGLLAAETSERVTKAIESARHGAEDDHDA